MHPGLVVSSADCSPMHPGQLSDDLEGVIQQREHLLTGDFLARRVHIVAYACGYSKPLRRREIAGVVGDARIGEVVSRVRIRRDTEGLHHHDDEFAACELRFRAVLTIAGAIGDASRCDEADRLIIPCARRYIDEGDARRLNAAQSFRRVGRRINIG